jgi:hypothetical protein
MTLYFTIRSLDMPFKSDSQRKLCYLLKGKGQAGSWDCDEWSTATGKKDLPEHVEDQTEKEALKYTNKLPGGVGDDKKPSDFPKGVLDGMYEEEKIHTNDPDIAKEMAVDHLTQDKDYYKKLDKVKKVEKAGSLAAVKALYSIWSDSSPFKAAAERTLLSKLSSVITSPGRGSGDEEETAINPDSSEGMQLTKPMKPVPGKMSFNQKGLKPVAPLGTARNALRRATEKNLGFDPAGGVKQAQSMVSLWKGIPGAMYRSMFGNGPRVPREKRPKKDWELSDFAEEYPELKTLNFQDLYRQSEQRVLERMAKDQFHGSPESLYAGNMILSKQADNFDFSSIGTKLDPSLLGGSRQAPSIQGVAPARGFDFANMTKSLQNTGRQVGEAATSEVEKWVKAPGWTSPMEVLKRRNQALGAQKAMGQATDSAGKVISGAQSLGKNFLSAGGTLMGMGKQSDVAAPSAGAAPAPKAAAPAASSPSPSLKSIGSGVMNAGSTAFQSMYNPEAFERLKAMSNRPDLPAMANNVSNYFKGTGDVSSTINGWADKAIDYGVNKYVGHDPAKPGFLTGAAANVLQNQAKGIKDTAATNIGGTFRGLGTMATNMGTKAYNAARQVPGVAPVMDTVGQSVKDVGRGMQQGMYDSAGQYEAERRTAGYALPVVNFMQNNPWAKYLLGALGTGVAGYGLHSMFSGQQKQQNGQAEGVLQNSYNQGLKGA